MSDPAPQSAARQKLSRFARLVENDMRAFTVQLAGTTDDRLTEEVQSIADDIRSRPPHLQPIGALALAAVSTDLHDQQERLVPLLRSLITKPEVAHAERSARTNVARRAAPTVAPTTANAMDRLLGPSSRPRALWDRIAPWTANRATSVEQFEQMVLRDASAPHDRTDAILAASGALRVLAGLQSSQREATWNLLDALPDIEEGDLVQALSSRAGSLPYTIALRNHIDGALTRVLQNQFDDHALARNLIAAAVFMKPALVLHRSVRNRQYALLQRLGNADLEGAFDMVREIAERQPNALHRVSRERLGLPTDEPDAVPSVEEPLSVGASEEYLRRNFQQVWLDVENQRLVQVSLPVVMGSNRDRVAVAYRSLSDRIVTRPNGQPMHLPFGPAERVHLAPTASVVSEIRQLEPLLPEMRVPAGKGMLYDARHRTDWAALSKTTTDAVVDALTQRGLVDVARAQALLEDHMPTTRRGARPTTPEAPVTTTQATRRRTTTGARPPSPAEPIDLDEVSNALGAGLVHGAGDRLGARERDSIRRASEGGQRTSHPQRDEGQPTSRNRWQLG